MRGFIAELSYRNVIRVGAAYVVAGWLVAQVTDLIADVFNLPDWFMQMVIILLVLGLPVALVLAWAFELTPEGIKNAHDVPRDAPKDPRAGRVLNVITIVALVIAVAWLAWDKIHRAPVTIAGVRVGEVSDIMLDRETFRARVTLRIDQDQNNIPSDSSAHSAAASARWR